jgi:hypothetical protein
VGVGVSALSIDAGASAAAVRTWVGWGDDLSRSALDLANDLDRLQLGDVTPMAGWSITAAATDLWTTSVFLQLVLERVELADVHGLTPSLDPATVTRLMQLAGGRVTSVVGACPVWMPPSFAGPHGELGGTYDAELRSPYLLGGVLAVDRGRDLLLRALDDTASSGRIRDDEFEIVRMSDGRYLVVLPGVTDLSNPDLGLSGIHASVRDVDQFAYPSSRSASTADNRYAQMVAEALAIRGVPVGSDLVIIGHSYGADTALDLAADPEFNGADGYRVTHVVAAGYHSQPQLVHVPDSTQVLVLQNNRDAAVIVESVGAAHVTEAIEARRSAVDDLLRFDLPGVFVNSGRALYHDAGVATAALDHTIRHADDVADIAIGIGMYDVRRAVDGAGDFVTLEPGVSRHGDSQVVAVFEGGGEGFGHHQDNYATFVERTDDPDVTAFLASLGAPHATTGTAWSIDISVP